MSQQIQTGSLVRSKRPGPGFREGALFRVISILTESSDSALVGCRALGENPFRVRYFRIPELEVVGKARAAAL